MYKYRTPAIIVTISLCFSAPSIFPVHYFSLTKLSQLTCKMVIFILFSPCIFFVQLFLWLIFIINLRAFFLWHQYPILSIPIPNQWSKITIALRNWSKLYRTFESATVWTNSRNFGTVHKWPKSHGFQSVSVAIFSFFYLLFPSHLLDWKCSKNATKLPSSNAHCQPIKPW